MTPDGRVLLTSAMIDGDRHDVLIESGVITAIAPRLRRPAGAELIDLDGRALLPGMWDNHVHFDQWALARQRLDLATAASAADAVERVRQRLITDPPPDGTALVGFGYRESRWPDVPDRTMLDRVSGSTPVVLVSGDLHACWVNSAAAGRYGQADHPTGVLRETEWQPIMTEIRRVPEHLMTGWVADATRAAAARGVVGIVDFEAPWQLDTWAERIAAGCDALRVVASVWPSHLDDPIHRGLRTGAVVADTGELLTMGPLKVVSDGSLNTRTAYCHDPYPEPAGIDWPCGMLLVPPAELVPLLHRAVRHDISVAVHAIGDRAAGHALDAFAEAGTRGRIEHAQLLTASDVARFAALGVVASIQPEHALDDRDVADHHWAGRTHRAYAYRSLLAAGVELVLGSDAPVAPLDPWVTVAAAVRRTSDDRPAWHPEQEIPLPAALAASAGPDGPLAVGRRADLVVVELDPATCDSAALRNMPVAATMVGGRWTHRSAV
jgi:predicted amidohydrolase YtcJ